MRRGQTPCLSCGKPSTGDRCRQCWGRAKRLRPESQCAVCAKTFFRSRAANDAHKCCSRECGFEYQRREKRARAEQLKRTRCAQYERSLKGVCIDCGDSFVGDGLGQLCCRACTQAWLSLHSTKNTGRICPMCSAKTERRAKVGPHPRFCSVDCRKAFYRRIAGKVYKKRPRRHQRIGGIQRIEVFRRDGWRCQICGRRCLKRAAVPNPRTATIDHIIPQSRGGDDVSRNLQTACYQCNTRKGVRAVGEQLRLCG